MVSVTDYRRKNGLIDSDAAAFQRPRKLRFRLLAALAAPFRDMDERALHKKRRRTDVQNNSKGNLFPSSSAPARVPVRRFSRGDG